MRTERPPLHLTMPVSKSPKSPHPSPNPNPNCKHSLVDLLFLLLLLLSSTFLISSLLSYFSHSLSLLFPSFSFPFFLFFLAFFSVAVAVAASLSSFACSRRCHRPACKAEKRAREFDLQLQSEDQLRAGKGAPGARVVEMVEKLPWKGGTENNPDYECLRAELRKMAPINGRAVLLFREKCGCPVAKLVGWGPKKAAGGKKNKK